MAHLTVDEHGAHAKWLPNVEANGFFAHLRFPALLLDSLFRLITRRGPTELRMGVPLAVDRIELHTTDNDVTLAHQHSSGCDLH